MERKTLSTKVIKRFMSAEDYARFITLYNNSLMPIGQRNGKEISPVALGWLEAYRNGTSIGEIARNSGTPYSKVYEGLKRAALAAARQ